jgi:hypothetical protein
MATGRHQFASFSLDPIERHLFAGDVPVELNTRYFDALLLLLAPGHAAQQGALPAGSLARHPSHRRSPDTVHQDFAAPTLSIPI